MARLTGPENHREPTDLARPRLHQGDPHATHRPRTRTRRWPVPRPQRLLRQPPHPRMHNILLGGFVRNEDTGYGKLAAAVYTKIVRFGKKMDENS